jgi:hypothetical protein
VNENNYTSVITLLTIATGASRIAPIILTHLNSAKPGKTINQFLAEVKRKRGHWRPQEWETVEKVLKYYADNPQKKGNIILLQNWTDKVSRFTFRTGRLVQARPVENEQPNQ